MIYLTLSSGRTGAFADTQTESSKVTNTKQKRDMVQKSFLIWVSQPLTPEKSKMSDVQEKLTSFILFSLCIFSQVRNIRERIILISTTGLR